MPSAPSPASLWRLIAPACFSIVLSGWVPLERGDAQERAPDGSEGFRSVVDLKGDWHLRVGEESLQPIEGRLHSEDLGDRVGESWEQSSRLRSTRGTVEALKFDGVGVYRKPVQFDTSDVGKNAFVEIDGAATSATVRWAGMDVTSHLGGWTPFRFSVGKLIEWARAAEEAEAEPFDERRMLEIEVDELVGHNTQGFLPIVAPHFGGIWKHVRLIEPKGPLYIDDLTLLLAGFGGDDRIRLSAQVRGVKPTDVSELELGYRISGPIADVKTDWQWGAIDPVALDSAAQAKAKRMAAAGTDLIQGEVDLRIEPPVVRRWSPDDPFLYEIDMVLRHRPSGEIWDRLGRKCGIRHFATDGRRLLVNGKPVNIRGVLNWGYSPPRLAPTTDEQAMRRELEFARERGFNLMKFCLWVPPRRYLELADEMGMLTWIEYPTWHPDFSAGKLEELKTEFNEFFHYDRNTVSAVLRSLTCETGHGASVDVIRELYDLGHRTIPNAIIEDDSSWIGWHRVHDFYDDHPYGNNHTWLEKLNSLNTHIVEREAKPLVLGEAIAADTWQWARHPLFGRGRGGPSSLRDAASPFASLSAAKQKAYARRLFEQHGMKFDEQREKTEIAPPSNRVPRPADSLSVDSRRIAMLMRKYQIEAFRWRLPDAGYVVSVIRDFPKAAMGLIDYRGDPKWSSEDFAWQQPLQLVIDDARLNRSVVAGQTWDSKICVDGEGPLPSDLSVELTWTLGEQAKKVLQLREASPASRSDQTSFPLQLDLPEVTSPTPLDLRARLLAADQPASSNHWRLWVIPRQSTATNGLRLFTADGVTAEQLSQWGIQPDQIVGTLAELRDSALQRAESDQPPVILARRFEAGLLDAIAAGAHCVMLPDGQAGSLVTRDHWFLRGSVVLNPQHPVVQHVNREMLVDLQTFDLAGPVLFEYALQDAGQPIVSLWDNHDLDDYRTHGLLWEAGIGSGSLLVSALNHGEGSGAAGPYVLRSLLQYVSSDRDLPQLPTETLRRLRAEVRRQQRSLAEQKWTFRPARERDLGAEPTALADAWQSEEVTKANGWQPISITSHWDGQGFGDLDGWGFYRTRLSIPAAWHGETLYLGFTGVDDYFDVYVDGQPIGSGGDIEKQETAFELRKSFVIPTSVTGDGELEIGVAVYDWYGAGGIFRPVFLSTEPLGEGSPLVVPR